MADPLIHAFIGTKAQYIKTAPLLRYMDECEIPYRLIDSGQHAGLATDLRSELGVRDPDYRFGGSSDISTIPAAMRWAVRLSGQLLRRNHLAREVFDNRGGICVVHGDTPSTLLSTLMARRTGLEVAHIEAGLRSHSIRHPFPEELIRIVVMRMSRWLFAPDATSAKNLKSMGVRGEIVQLSANTNVEALSRSLTSLPEVASGPVIVTSHRVENLKHRNRLDQLVALATSIAESRPVTFVLHGPTEQTLTRKHLLDQLRSSRVDILPLQPHRAFTRSLAAAPFVITDGGSIQEECALLGVPTLLWRRRTERDDGIGRNVVVSGYEEATIKEFLGDPDRYRYPTQPWDAEPAAEIAAVLTANLDGRRT